MKHCVLFFFSLACCTEAAAQSIQERVARDELAIVEPDDPDMVAAIRKGRETLPEFLALASAPKPAMTNFSVKVAVRSEQQYEYIWIAPFKEENGTYFGVIKNIPRWATHLKKGDVLTFAESEIVDWLYIEDRKMKGNFTVCATLRKEPKSEAELFKKQYGLNCD